AMHAGGFVTFARIAPVKHEDPAIRPVAQIEPAKPAIAKRKTVLPVARYIARASAPKNLLIYQPAMQVKREEMSAIFSRPIVPEINHRTAMRMSTAIVHGGAVARSCPTFPRIEVPMVRVHINDLISARVGFD